MTTSKHKHTKTRAKSKREQLIAALSKPNGVRTSVLAAKFDWQPHTLRAAISRLRSEGLNVQSKRSEKHKETVYSLVQSEDRHSETVSRRSIQDSKCEGEDVATVEDHGGADASANPSSNTVGTR